MNASDCTLRMLRGCWLQDEIVFKFVETAVVQAQPAQRVLTLWLCRADSCRMTTKVTQIGKYTVPAGTIVGECREYPSSKAVGRDNKRLRTSCHVGQLVEVVIARVCAILLSLQRLLHTQLCPSIPTLLMY